MEVFIIEKIFTIFSVGYLLSVIAGSYMVIKIIDSLNKKAHIVSWVKDLITLIVGAILFVVFKKYTDASVESLVTTYFMAVFVYDKAVKIAMQKLGVAYKKIKE